MKTVGHRFLCLKDVVFGSSDIMYKAGKVYMSEVEGCITNEEGNRMHEWIENDYDIYWKQFFNIIGNKRRSGNFRRR